MKVSFLVTYYNQAEFVRQSIDSILAIDKPCDWEIIVGDDGSTDNTVEVVNDYIKLYPDKIKLYVMPRDNSIKYDSVQRASANRLYILEHSSGDIFCTLDGDDYYCDANFIKDAIDVFEKHEDVSVVVFGFRYVNNGVSGKDVLLPAELNNQFVEKRNFLKHFYLHAGGCVHRKCFGKDRIQFIKKLGFFDDNNIVINSLNFGEMVAVNRAIYAYRQAGQSLYTSMIELEQAVLNVQGMDVDLRLIDESLKEYVKERYSSAVILMYVWRRKIRHILGNDKCNKYEKGCSNLTPSFCFDLLNYQSLTNERKKEIKAFLRLKKKYTIKQYVKFFLRGIC